MSDMLGPAHPMTHGLRRSESGHLGHSEIAVIRYVAEDKAEEGFERRADQDLCGRCASIRDESKGTDR